MLKTTNAIKHLITIVSVLAMMSFALFANNLQISNISYAQGASTTVTFSISWDNSWRIAAGPANWDAVWLIIKYKNCMDAASVAYSHATLNSALNQHTLNGLEAMSTIITPGTYDGSTQITAGAPYSGILDDTKGIMLRRGTTGTGTIATTTVTLKTTDIPTSGNFTIKVIGTEMVYIPQGDFYIGDGTGDGTGATYRFLSAANNNAVPMFITNANETAATTLYYANTPTTVANVPAAWPKGQCGFYMMKYEITEAKYAEFLNTLSSSAQSYRFPGNVGTNRNQLQQKSAGVYVAGRPSRAQNWLSWADVSAYLDWACLRPMTELEYEKTARGINASLKGEYAWGKVIINAATTFNTPAIENGMETMNSGANCAYNGTSYTGGDAGQGPLRSGIFSLINSGRVWSGASYYGVMELSGNVREYVVSLHSTAANNTFTRAYGDGVVDDNTGLTATTGVTQYWPSATNTDANPGSGWTFYVGNRGGDWGSSTTYLQVSDRSQCYTPIIVRSQYMGGRGVR